MSRTATVTSDLPALGPGISLAVFPPSYRTVERRLKRSEWSSALRVLLRNSAIIAPLDIQLTLPAALTRSPFAAGTHEAAVYRHVKIARLDLPGCRASLLPSVYYGAGFEGYAVVAARLAPVESVIDAGTKARASLAGGGFDKALRERPDSRSIRFVIRPELAAQRFPGLLGLLHRVFRISVAKRAAVAAGAAFGPAKPKPGS